MLKKRQKNLEKYKIKRLSRESIEAEEIFLDSKKIKESPESEREKLEFPIKKGRVYFLYFLIPHNIQFKIGINFAVNCC